MKLAINTKTQAQFDALMKHYESKGWVHFMGDPKFKYAGNTIIEYENGYAIGGKDSFDDHTILTFEQFAEIAGIEVPVEVPEYVECVEANTTSFIQGKIYPIVRQIFFDENAIGYSYDTRINMKSKFKPSTRAAYEAQQKPKVIKLDDDAIGWIENGEVKVKMPLADCMVTIKHSFNDIKKLYKATKKWTTQK